MFIKSIVHPEGKKIGVVCIFIIVVGRHGKETVTSRKNTVPILVSCIDNIQALNASVFVFSPGLLLSPRHHLSVSLMMALNLCLLLEAALSLKSREGPPIPMSRESKGNNLHCDKCHRNALLKICFIACITLSGQGQMKLKSSLLQTVKLIDKRNGHLDCSAEEISGFLPDTHSDPATEQDLGLNKAVINRPSPSTEFAVTKLRG